MEREINLENEVHNLNAERKVENSRSIYEPKRVVELLYSYWISHFENDDRHLKVYVDREEDKYYISINAAATLGIVYHNYVMELEEKNIGLLEISKNTLKALQQIFKDRITYEYLPRKKVEYVNPDEDDFDKYLYNFPVDKGYNNTFDIPEEYQNNEKKR